MPLKLFDKLNEPLNERQIYILELIANNKNTTIIELKSTLNAGRETIKRDLHFSQENNFIKSVVSKKTGYW